jgi:hypothetical protein
MPRKLKHPMVCQNCLDDILYAVDGQWVPVYEGKEQVSWKVCCNKCIKKLKIKDTKPI